MSDRNCIDIKDVETAIQWALKFENTEVLEAMAVQELGRNDFKVIYYLNHPPTEDEDEILALICTEYDAQIGSLSYKIKEEFKIVENLPLKPNPLLRFVYIKNPKYGG